MMTFTNPLRTIALAMLSIFVLSIPTEDAVVLAGGSLTKLIGVAAFGVGVAALFRKDKLVFKPPSLFLIVTALFMVWGFVSYYWSLSPDRAVSRSVTFAQLLIMCWMVWEFGRTERDRAVLMQAYLLGAYITLYIALSAFFTSEAGFRDVGADINANDFAVVLAFGIPMAWRLTFFFKNRLLYWLNVLYLPLAISGIVVVASRGGFISALVALMIIPVTFNKLGLLRKLGLVVLLVAGTWFIFFYAPQLFPNLQASTARLSETSSELTSGTLTGRRVIWAAGFELFREYPFFGVGQGGFERAVVDTSYGRSVSSHNAYLSVLVQTGLVGLVLFLLVIASVLLPALIGRFKQRSFTIILLMTLLVSIFSLNADYYKFTWFVLSLLACEVPILAVDSQTEARRGARTGVPAKA